MKMLLTERIDQWNDRFFSNCRARLKLAELTITQLEWLTLEHFQFSQRNPGLLEHAADMTRGLPRVHAELRRNCAEESGHAQLYQAGLAALGLEVARREWFAPTDEFLDWLQELILATPSQTLGVMYATESAAIFEHQVFKEAGLLLTAAKGLSGEALLHFHNMHLEGVEQGHKDGLGAIISAAQAADSAQTAIVLNEVSRGAWMAIKAMESWWSALLRHCNQ